MTRTDLLAAAHALARHDLVTAFGHVSCREGDTMLITGPVDLATAGESDLVRVGLHCVRLPEGAPPEAWAHLAIYRARFDVEAVVRAMPPSGFAAASVTEAVLPVHGQAAWVGSVPVHDSALLLRSAELATAAAATLGSGDAVLLRGNGALTVGDSPGVAVARMWLLEVACRTWLKASSSGTPRPLSVEETRAWRHAGAGLLPRLWRHLAGQE